MTQEEQDEKEFEELWRLENPGTHPEGCLCQACEDEIQTKPECLHYWLASRRLLREREAKNQLVLPDGCLLANTNGVVEKK